MSKGSPMVTFRMAEHLEAAMMKEIEETNARRPCLEPWTRTTWILQAIREKIQHSQRSRTRKTGNTMINHYATATCDACGQQSKAMTTAAEQQREIVAKGWEVRERKCYCPKCVKIFRTITANEEKRCQ